MRGWEPVTTYTYDGDGRMVSSVAEVEWDEQSTAWMLALHFYRRLCCPGCGGNLDITTDPENEEKYVAELPIQCYRCVAFSRSTKVYSEEPHPSSFIHVVPTVPRRRKRPPASPE